MAHVLLGATGSVAAIRTPMLWQRLTQAGHEVKVVATSASLYFFDPAQLGRPAAGQPRDPAVLILDEDEWPRRDTGALYRRDEPVLHIELRRWADVLVVAPLDANTLAKFAGGLCDNCLTCVWRAWDAGKPVLLAPAMNTHMWYRPITARHLLQVADDLSATEIAAHRDSHEAPHPRDPDEAVALINARASGGARLLIAPPQCKQLACGDVGMGAMADVEQIVQWVEQLLPHL